MPAELGHAFFREGRCLKFACARTGTFLSLGRKTGEAWEWASFRLRLGDIGTMLALLEGNVPEWQFVFRQGEEQRELGVQSMRTGLRVELAGEEWFLNLGEAAVSRIILAAAVPYEIRASEERRSYEERPQRTTTEGTPTVDEQEA